MIGAGELKARIRLRVQTDVPNGQFGVDSTFDTGIALWAKHEPVHGLAIRAGMQTGEVPTDLFFVRYSPGTRPKDLTAAHVIDWDARRYRVMDAIDVEGAHRITRITTKDLGAI